MFKMKKSGLVLTIIGTMLATFMLIGCGLYFYITSNDIIMVSRSEYETAIQLQDKYTKLYQLQTMIDENFLWEVDGEAQTDEMCRAMLDALGDEYSYYMTAEEYEDWSAMVTGTFTGIGVVFTEDTDGQYVVNRVMEGGPADAAGMKAGDILLKADGKEYADSTQMAAAIRGEEGTSVEITYKRGKEVKTVSIVRAEVKELSVYSSIVDEKYGYIQITSFEEETAKQFETELKEMENKGVEGLIIDLRDNPGGMMDQSIEIADMLLPEAMITYTEDRNGEKETYNSDEHCTKLNYVVLVNGNSASASEIVSAAIKDNQGGPLVGTTTFGKGIIQGTYDLGDGSAMSLTIMQYFSPNGSKIHGVGIEPDYVVELPADAKTDVQLEKAIELLK